MKDAIAKAWPLIDESAESHFNRYLLYVYEARLAVEMIVAVFESQRQGQPISLPLANRRNPLSML